MLWSIANSDAGTIILETSLKIDSTIDLISCNLQVKNTGDEAATHMRATAWLGGKKFTRSLTTSLGPSQTTKSIIDFSAADLSNGTYHIVVYLDHADLNGYEMSSVSVVPFTMNRSGEPMIQVVAENLVLNTNDELTARIKNSSNQELAVDYRLLLPRELTADTGTSLCKIPAGEVKHIVIRIDNFSGLNGSEFSAYLIAEYTTGNIHNSVSAPFRIRIDTDEIAETFSTKRQVYLLVLVLGLLSVSATAVYWGRQK